MKNISNINALNPLATEARKHSVKEDGFQKQLNEILFATKEKEAEIKQAGKERFTYSLSDLNLMNATQSSQTHLSANMLSLYTAQENKNQKSGKGRAVTAASTIY